MRIILALLLTLPLGCSHKSSSSGDPGSDPGGALDGGVSDGYFAPSALSVSGHVVDFESGQPLSSPATMATAALVPPPNVSVMGANFTLDAVPPYSTFFLAAGSPPDHRLTYNAPTTVTDQPVSDVTAYAVADAYLTKLRTGFGVTADSGTATVFVRVVDGNGNAAAGVPATALVPDAAANAKGPYFLDTGLQPTPNATATSASGWMVYFNVPAGTFKIAAGAGYTLQIADTPTAGDAVSLNVATLTTGTATMPTSVSFTKDVVPIFTSRGCYNCHSGNGDGRRLGDLVLDGSPMKIFKALTIDISPTYKTTRTNIGAPEKSLVLTMPSYETPPDPHPTVVFTSSADPDYQKILTWIKAGAKYN